MGPSGKWIKSLAGLKAPSAAGKGKKKWSRLWRSSSRGAGNDSPCETSSTTSANAFSSVFAAVVRAPPKDFRVIREEWAAVRVQTAFRAFLARRALKALRGIVRLQALVRGRLVRRQLAATIKGLHALLRVQERARHSRARPSADGRGSEDSLSDRNGGRADPAKEAEARWCNSQGSVIEVTSKIQMRHEAAVKRERAIAYALSHQPRSSKYRSRSRPSSPTTSTLRNHESYIEGWMATKPWESRLMNQNHNESHGLKNCDELNISGSRLSNAGSVRIRRNNVTTRVEAKPPSVISASSSDFVCDEGSPSQSSVTPASATNLSASEARSHSVHGGGPSYMSLTKSAKARLNGFSCNSERGKFQIQRQRSADMSYHKRVALSSLDAESNAGSEISVTSRQLNSMSLNGRNMTSSLDKENAR